MVQPDSFRSWLYLALGSLVCFFTIGFMDAFGLLVVYLVDHYNESNSKAAWLGSLLFFTAFALYPVTLAIASRIGIRNIVVIATILIVPIFLLSPLSPNMDILFLSYSIPFGIACSIIDYTSLRTILQYFKSHRGVAFGTRVGVSVLGTTTYAFLLPTLMDSFGWTLTFWILSGMSIPCLAFACLYEDRKKEPEAIDDYGIEQKRICFTYYEYLKDKRFLIMLLGLTVFYSVISMPAVFLVRFAVTIGYAMPKAKWLFVVKGSISAATRFLAGRVGDLAFKREKVRHVVLIVMVLYSLATFLCSFTTSFIFLMLYMAFISVCEGTFWTILPLYATEIAGSKHPDKAIALVNCFGSFAMLGGLPLLGLIYDETCNFNAVFYTTSAVSTVGACLLVIGINLPNKTLHRNDKDIIDQRTSSLHNFYTDSCKKQYITMV